RAGGGEGGFRVRARDGDRPRRRILIGPAFFGRPDTFISRIVPIVDRPGPGRLQECRQTAAVSGNTPPVPVSAAAGSRVAQTQRRGTASQEVRPCFAESLSWNGTR